MRAICVATFATPLMALMPATAASIPAVKVCNARLGHGEWRLLRALISRAAGQQFLPRNATEVVLLAERSRHALRSPRGSVVMGRTDERQLAAPRRA